MSGDELRRRRERLNLTQEALGKRLGVTKMSIFRYERSKRIPKVVELAIRQIEREDAAA